MTSTQPAKQVDTSKIWRTGALAVVGSVVANLVAYFIVRALFDLPAPADFPPLSPAAVGGLTALFTLVGVVVFAVVARRADNPMRAYWIIATIAVVLISIPNVISAMNPNAVPFPFAEPSASGFLILIVFHIIAYLITAWTLTTRTAD